MQQYNYLKQQFQLPKLPSIRLKNKNHTTIQNGQLLVIAAWFFTVFNLFGLLHPLTVLIFGLALPIYCSYIDIYISKYYFELLAIMIWVRLWSETFMSFDSWIFICMWHPNLRFSQRLMEFIQMKMKAKNTSLIDKIDQKISKYLD